MKTRYLLMTDTMALGRVPGECDNDGYPVLYEEVHEADAAVARLMIDQYEEVIAGVRELDEVGEPDSVVAVSVAENGDLIDGAGVVLGNVTRSMF